MCDAFSSRERWQHERVRGDDHGDDRRAEERHQRPGNLPWARPYPAGMDVDHVAGVAPTRRGASSRTNGGTCRRRTSPADARRSGRLVRPNENGKLMEKLMMVFVGADGLNEADHQLSELAVLVRQPAQRPDRLGISLDSFGDGMFHHLTRRLRPLRIRSDGACSAFPFTRTLGLAHRGNRPGRRVVLWLTGWPAMVPSEPRSCCRSSSELNALRVMGPIALWVILPLAVLRFRRISRLHLLRNRAPPSLLEHGPASTGCGELPRSCVSRFRSRSRSSRSSSSSASSPTGPTSSCPTCGSSKNSNNTTSR